MRFENEEALEEFRRKFLELVHPLQKFILESTDDTMTILIGRDRATILFETYNAFFSDDENKKKAFKEFLRNNS